MIDCWQCMLRKVLYLHSVAASYFTCMTFLGIWKISLAHHLLYLYGQSWKFLLIGSSFFDKYQWIHQKLCLVEAFERESRWIHYIIVTMLKMSFSLIICLMWSFAVNGPLQLTVWYSMTDLAFPAKQSKCDNKFAQTIILSNVSIFWKKFQLILMIYLFPLAQAFHLLTIVSRRREELFTE